MLRKLTLPNRSRRMEWWRRLDRIAADLNILLLMFAIGLATLDLTFVVTRQVIDQLPQMTRIVYVDKPAASPRLAADQSSLR